MSYHIRFLSGSFELCTTSETLKSHILKNYSVIDSPTQNPLFTIHVFSKAIKHKIEIKMVSKNEGVVYLNDAWGEIHFNEFSFYLKCLVQFIGFKYDAFLIHASSFVHEGYGYVFSGKSGIGKSTIVSFANRNHIVADDTVFITRIKNQFVLFPSSFEKNNSWYEDFPIPLQKIFFLHQCGKTYVHDIQSPLREHLCMENNFLFELLQQFTVTREYFTMKSIIYEFAHELSQSVAIQNLYFEKNQKFLSLIGLPKGGLKKPKHKIE